MRPNPWQGQIRLPVLFIVISVLMMSIGIVQATDGIMQLPGQDLEGESTVRGVFANDAETIANAANPPYVGIVHILYDNGGSCTGFVISPLHVMTAASCVENDSGNRITSADSVVVVAGRDEGDEPYGRFPVSQNTSDIYIAPGWNPSSTTPITSDYAVLTLEAPLPGDTNFFQLTDTDNVKSFDYTIAGYPNQCRYTTQCGGVMYKDSGMVNEYDEGGVDTDFGAPAGELRYQIDAVELGQQGSPIYRNDGGTYRVVGLHSRFSDTLYNGKEYNQGVEITSTVLSQLTSWGIPYNGSDSSKIREPGDTGGFRNAITDANADSSNPWTILLSPGITYTFSGSASGVDSALPVITGNVTIVGRGATITENSSSDIRFAQVDGKLILTDDLTISGFDAGSSRDGAAVQLPGSAELRVIGTVFENNRARDGGALYLGSGSSAFIEYARFETNAAFSNGGAIFSTGSSVTVIGNALGNEGISTATFGDNDAQSVAGGAIHSEGGGSLQVSDAIFVENLAGGSSANGLGGAISNTGSGTLSIDNTDFTGNQSSFRGGAVYHTSTGQATIESAILTENEAGPQGAADITERGEGAAVYAGGPMTMTVVEVIDNRSYRKDQVSALNDAYKGGAIVIGADFTMQNSGDFNLVVDNKIWFDWDLNLDKTDSDVVSDGAAFYILPETPNSANIVINDTCINGNLSQDFQGVYNGNTNVSVNAENNWWGSTTGPNTIGEGDRISTAVDFQPYINSTSGLPSPCAQSAPPPTNDEMVAALEEPFILNLLDETQLFNNQNATITGTDGADEPSPATCGPSNKTVWYTYTPLKSYDVSITISPYSSSAPIVAVWKGDPADRDNSDLFQLVSCDAGTSDLAAQIENLPLDANTQYWIQVGTTGGDTAGGASQISLTSEKIELVSPLSGISNRRPTFVWTSIGYADTYTLSVTDDTFGITEEVVIPASDPRCDATRCEFPWGVLLPNSNYDWQVTVTDNSLGTLTPPQNTEFPSSTVSFPINSTGTNNHISNNEFVQGTDFFDFTTDLTAQVNAQGVLEAYGTVLSAPETITQVTDFAPLQGTPFELTLLLGNSSTTTKNITVQLTNPGAVGTPIACNFSVFQSLPLSTYVVRGVTDADWTGLNFEIELTGDNTPALLVDDIILNYEPTLSITGTECEAPVSPDVDGDGFITPSDVVYVVNRVNTTDFTADLNNSQSVTDVDVQIVMDLLGQAYP